MLRLAALALIVVVLTTAIFFRMDSSAHAVQSTNKTISFQGRLLTAAGAVVPDGNYNMQFKIYQDGAGNAVGNPGGSLKWTETHVNNGGTNGIQVRNGFFSVALGSVNTFGTSVDWTQDTLWLSMNIAGSSAGCTSFGSVPCSADGEMLPMKRLTATPYAINSGAVGGKTANELVQLGQDTQIDTSSNSSISINKTGSGNLIQLQASGADAFTVNNAGNIQLGSASNQSISVESSSSGVGKTLTVSAGSSASGSEQAGGDLILQAGAGDGEADGGDVIVKANSSNSSGTFQVQDADGTAVLNVNAANNTVSVGTLKFSPSVEGGMIEHNIWEESDQYGTVYEDANVNLGTVFQSATSGVVSGIKFYNPAGNNAAGTQVGKLWSCPNVNCNLFAGGDVSELAVVTFAADSTEGWKTARFSHPVPIEANTKYVVSYFIDSGKYMAAPNYFVSPHTNGVLTAPSNENVNNGVYNAGSASFPNLSYNKTAYWVDVVFETASSASDQITSTKALEINATGTLTLGSDIHPTHVQGSTVTLESAGNVTLQSNSMNVLTARTNTLGQATVGIGNDASAGYALDVTGDINTSNGYAINGQTVLTTDSLTLGQSSATGTISSAVNRSLTLDGWTGVNVISYGSTVAQFGEKNVVIGDGTGLGDATLLTLDKSDSAPAIADESAYLGSMYYDTALGKVQCFEADGWGACGASPDAFVSLSPEYANAVMNGADIGTISSDLCSDALNINDGSSSQPSVCGTNETYNFYKWTSAESTAQTRSIYVTYQLPAHFKSFIAGSTSLMGRTDSTNSSVTYQIYRDNADDGLVACGGSPITVSTGVQSTWQKTVASGGADPASCGFTPGDSMLIRINLSAHSNANAYVSNLKFTHSAN